MEELIKENVATHEEEIREKIKTHNNWSLKINWQITFIFSLEQLSPLELIIGFTIISSLYLLLPPNFILEVYAKIASEIPELWESYLIPSK